jgi:lysophospholipase L1-like esterase
MLKIFNISVFICALAAVFSMQQASAQTKQSADSAAIKAKQAEAWANFQKMIEDRVHHDWAWLKRYEGDNEKLGPPEAGEKRVVFIGNSITEGWINTDPEYFRQYGYINRGIGGQTTPQLLVRFREDVINLHPAVVVILAGINDIAENTGPSKLNDVFGNIISMAELAKANHIQVVLSSVLPASGFSWHPGIDPRPKIAALNHLLAQYAAQHGLAYINYHSAMVATDQGMRKELATDGVHPNLAGYKLMEPLADAAIRQSLKRVK